MKKNIFFEVVEVTPTLAKEWLISLDQQQRQLRTNVVQQYARDMIAGAWRLTHQPIAFDVEGRLIDGQHRLHAVIESGQVVQMAVARDIDGDYGLPIDVGFRRTARDLLHLPNQVISAAIVLRKLQKGTLRHQERTSARATVDEIREVYTGNQEDIDASCLIIGKGVATAACAGAVAFARPVNQEKTDLFISAVKNGANLPVNSPALQLRNWFLRHSNRTSLEVIMVTLTALYAEFRGAQTHALHTTSAGYDGICAKRRALRILPTPPASGVPQNTKSPIQHRILNLLRAQGETEYRIICNEIGDQVSASAVSDALFKLKKKGLVYSSSPKHWDIVLDEDAEDNSGGGGEQ